MCFKRPMFERKRLGLGVYKGLGFRARQKRIACQRKVRSTNYVSTVLQMLHALNMKQSVSQCIVDKLRPP